MKKLLKDWIYRVALICLLLFIGDRANATHLFGADLHYDNVSGLNYKVILDVYGDCSGSAFPSLATATPEIQVYNNGVLYNTMNLTLTGTGVEVTPVCASQINNTTCNGGTIPGIKKFSYQGNVTLSGGSANWVFKFTGTMGGPSNQAGRSASITNIVTGISVMCLQATLNNTLAQNSSVTYTTLPTPFFCINKPAQYNPGAVDPNNDSLSFALVPGLSTGGTVNYLSPYTATAPLATAAGTFSTNSVTGQVSFTPNQVQNSLIVSRVSEYKNGVLVGTSMREMVFVVLSNCNNNPPTGAISSTTGGTSTSNTSIYACQGQAAITFHILPTDLDGDSISVATAGIPSGAVVTITGNNTTSPNVYFSWNTSSAVPGNYVFFVTYTDNGCPLSSKQTLAYSINIAPKPVVLYNLVAGATCVSKGIYSLYITGSNPINIAVTQGSSTVQTANNVGQNFTDSLVPGTYTISVNDATGCSKAISATITSPPVFSATYIVSGATCYGLSNGTISSIVSGGQNPFQYAIGSGSYLSTPSFSGLAAGTYVYKIKDANNCTKDTSLTITMPTPITANYSITNLLCYGANTGALTSGASGGTSPYQYALGSGSYAGSPVFNGLVTGTYVYKIEDANNCTKDTTLTITSPTQLHIVVNAIVNASCFGLSNGSIILNANGGTPGYKFSINGGTYSVSNSFSNLSAGSYLISAKDSNNCTHDTTISITQPSSLAANVNITSPLCFGDANGSYAVMASGGTTPYSYANGAGPFSNNNNFSALTAGTYVAHIKDNNNCTHDTTITITQPSEVAISFIFTNAKCFGDANGTITINGNGGTPTYTYSYNSNPYQANNQVNNLIAGNYTISVKDAHGCKHDSTLTITQPTPLHLTNLQIVNPTCDGYTDGSVSFAGIGGTTPYLYNINNGNYSSLNVFQSLGQGSYQLTVKDSNNCTHDTTVNLVGYPPIYVDSATITPASCFGVNDGTLTVHASGGNAPLKYALNSGLPGLSNFFTGLAATNYSIKVVDNTGCEKDSSIFIPSPVVMDLSFVIANNDCVGTDDAGAIGVHVSGGNAPYAYLWNNAATTDSIFGLNNGHYFVVVTDAKGCIDTGFADINYGDCCTVFVPTAFTPNNDNKNDKIGVLFKGDMVMKEFSIFNRFGQRVFFSQNVSDKWDGNFNGVAQEIGTYFYFIKAVCGYQQNMDKLFKGDFTLIR